MKVNLKDMSTEKRNEKTLNLYKMSSHDIIKCMNEEDKEVPKAIEKIIPDIAKVADAAKTSLQNGGRIIYMGAGTSGRLGVLDAVECPPTFGVTPETVVGLIAGGKNAFVKAFEGAEDRENLGKQDLIDLHLTPNDLVVGVAASGRTPYVIGGLKYANEIGCKTGSVCCNNNAQISKYAKFPIEVVVGPEVLTGSTRLKAGTAQKLILNMISTSAMVGVGKVYQNLMVDVMQTNEKLCVRAQNIVMEVTGVTRDIAEQTIKQADGSVKLAITKILANCDIEQAKKRLDISGGHISEALKVN